MKTKDFSSLSSIDSSRVSILLQSNNTWICLVDGESYLVDSSDDYAFVRQWVERFLLCIYDL